MSLARKMFLGRVTLPALAATSLYQMMRDSSLHWGFETTALTTPSLDSIIGSEVKISPDAPVLVGSDSSVSTLTGFTIPIGLNPPFSLADFGDDFGGIDPNQIWFFRESGTGMSVIFHAR